MKCPTTFVFSGLLNTCPFSRVQIGFKSRFVPHSITSMMVFLRQDTGLRTYIQADPRVGLFLCATLVLFVEGFCRYDVSNGVFTRYPFPD